MSERRRGLGRGLGALIPQAPVRLEGEPSPLDTLIPERQRPHPGGDEAGRGNGGQGDSGDGRARPVSTGLAERAVVSLAGLPAPLHDGPAAVPADESAPGSQDASDPLDAYFTEIPVGAVSPNPRQPRQVFDEEAMAELVHSIREIGLLQPVVVRPVGAERYELVMGERRWRAAQEAGLTHVPAIVRATEDSDLLRDALLENLHRSQLNPLEEAAAYDQLLQDFGCTHDELAQRIGRSRPQISNTLRLLRLPPTVQRRVAAGVLSAGHAKALLGLEDGGSMERLAQRVVAEGLSVRAAEEIVALGDGRGASPSRARRSRPPVAPRVDELAASLADRLETRVKIDLGRSRGKIVVEFATLEDLERIVAAMAPAGPARSSGSDGERQGDEAEASDTWHE